MENHQSLFSAQMAGGDAEVPINGGDDPQAFEEMDEAWNALSEPIRDALEFSLNVSSTEELLEIDDQRIASVVKGGHRCGAVAVAQVQRWLFTQRTLRGQPVGSPVEAKLRADAIVAQARDDIAASIRTTMSHQRLSTDDVARRVGISREAVASVASGSSPGNFDLALRMAVALGVQVRVAVG